eukprot:gene37020-45666_t
MICGGLNMSNWGGDNASVVVENQVVEWVKTWFNFPDKAKGLFVTGSSMANFMALLTAKAHILGTSVRKTGIRDEQECRGMYRRQENPLAVIVSAGTVDVGAIDDFNAVADICQEYGIWMHVDGAYGALGILSPEIRPKL